ncbi:ABC transporter permease [Ornithinicoccus halotolerans]|uniref:ABC transporter permease n=1 Tax=Ornithinicoccus halotolerans TaxID=1748220 RepID=UPI001885B002|nr:ABC transporter permease [Ornithinicoccus halotolerans]
MNARLGGKYYPLALAGLVVVLFVVLTILAPNTYPTLRNIASMASQMAPIGLLAVCVCLTFLIGGIDLSIVAVANAGAIAAAMTATALAGSLGDTTASLVGVVACLTVGAVAGTINGMLVSRLRVHPIPITLGTLALFTGISTGITGGSTQYGTGTLGFLGRGTLIGVPVAFLTLVGIVVALHYLTVRTRFGFRMYSVGASSRVSRYARLHVERVQVRTYVLSGLIASTAGLIMFASTNAANVSFGSSFLIQAILVAVLSGVNPYGGRGLVVAVLLAVAAMQQVQTGINLALGRWSGANFAAEFAWGVLLIAVLGLNTRAQQRKRKTVPRQPSPQQEASA